MILNDCRIIKVFFSPRKKIWTYICDDEDGQFVRKAHLFLLQTAQEYIILLDNPSENNSRMQNTIGEGIARWC